MSIKKEKARKKRLYSLGWEEDDDYNWRCSKCKQHRHLVDCGICKRCESCFDCQPDTELGQKALETYRSGNSTTINFDIFGEEYGY